MEIIKASPGERICIGRRGEHLARQVQFDLTQWIQTYGEGRAELLYQRPGNLVPYPIATERQENLLLWTITHTDTAHAGRGGRAEIRYYVGEVLVILEISYIQVEHTLENPMDAPEPPGADWFGQMLAQVERVNAPSLNAPIINPETGTWMIWNQEAAQYEDSGFPTHGPTGPQGIQGEKGEKGDPGETGPQGIQGSKGETGAQGPQGARGPRGYDGMDGEDGMDGADGESDYIQSVSYRLSSEDGGENVITLHTRLSGSHAFIVRNGSRGSTGADGKDGATSDEVIAAMTRETWTFTLEDGSTVTKVVPLV